MITAPAYGSGSNNRKAAYEYDGIGRINKRTVTAGG